MIIQVTSKVVSDPHWYPLLDLVVTLLEQPETRHSFDVVQLAQVAESGWLRGAIGVRASTVEFIRAKAKSAARAALSDGATLRIDDAAPQGGENVNGKVIRARPLDALMILIQPLYLIVEDETSDGAFLLWMARLLGKDAVIRSYRAGRLVFRHAGGKGNLERSAKALSLGVWPRTGRPILSLSLRAIAVLDSDAEYPGHEPNAAIGKKVSPYVAFVHILKERSIESYLPYRYLRRWANTPGLERAVEALSHMDGTARQYFPMKTGFKAGDSARPQSHSDFIRNTCIDKKTRDLYMNVRPDDWALFVGGFGKRLSEVYYDPKHRCEPKTEARLLSSAQSYEIDRLLTEIIRYL